MAIRSSPFTGVVISGNDIAKFEKQVEKTAPSKAAKNTFVQGQRLAEEYSKNGFVRVEGKGKR